MARPDQQGPINRKRAEPVKELEEEKDIEGGEKDANESEQKQGNEQNTLGNAALQSQMIAADDGAPSGEGGGGGLALRRAGMEAAQEFGGDGDGDADLPLTLEDLVRSWNPGTPKTKDRPSWLEPMPSDELPPEDPAFLERVTSEAPRHVRAGFTLAAQLQPSASVVAAGLIDWCDEAMRWCGQSLLERSIAHILRAGSSFLQDPQGRVLLTRARMAAVSNLLLQASPALQHGTDSADVAFLMFCLELSGHRRHAEMVRIDPGVEGKRMPKSPEVFDRCFDGPPRSVDPRALPAAVQARLSAVLHALFDMENPRVYLPSMVAEIPEDEEDPLGLDALIAELTGGAKDPEDALYYSALQAAERIAAATARTRVHTAAVAVTIAQVSRQWSSGAPTETLRQRCKTLDVASDKTLRLLVEIARAAQKRNVPPKGLKAGLTRATRGLHKAHLNTLLVLGEVVGGVLPGTPDLLPVPSPVEDPLTWAWRDGMPRDALTWMRSRPDTPTNRAALLLTEAASGVDLRTLGEPLLAAAEEFEDPLLAAAVRVLAGPCLIAAGSFECASALCTRHLDYATASRNGAVLADAALMGMQALSESDAETLRERAGRLAFELGAPGALTMLARYTRTIPQA